VYLVGHKIQQAKQIGIHTYSKVQVDEGKGLSPELLTVGGSTPITLSSPCLSYIFSPVADIAPLLAVRPMYIIFKNTVKMPSPTGGIFPSPRPLQAADDADSLLFMTTAHWCTVLRNC